MCGKNTLTNPNSIVSYKQETTNANGDEEWYDATNRLHRTHGPAEVRTNGDRLWYFNNQCHREDGPAIEWAHGDCEWRQHGKRHREDGPAMIHTNGNVSWYLEGVEITFENWAKFMNKNKCKYQPISDTDLMFLKLKWGV